MKNIKTPLTTWNWLKIGYSSWLYWFARRMICFNKKIIDFQWNVPFFYYICSLQKEDEKNAVCKKS